KLSVGYALRNFDITLTALRFQIFDSQRNNDSYRAEPQLDMNFYRNNVGPFVTRIYSQIVNFTNVNPKLPEALRLHIEPVVTLPLSSRWGSLNSEVKFLMTHYQQKNLDAY